MTGSRGRLARSHHCPSPQEKELIGIDEPNTHETYEVTGPQLLSFAEAVETIANGAAVPVEFTSVPRDAWITALRADGLPPEVADLLTHLFTEVLDGRNSWLGDGVNRALGRSPKSFATYVTQAAGAQAWS